MMSSRCRKPDCIPFLLAVFECFGGGGVCGKEWILAFCWPLVVCFVAGSLSAWSTG